MINETMYLCSNCGKNGHMFQNCKYPITSIGIIVYRKNIKGVIEYLMIRRKDTIGYIEFIRGKYPICNKEYIKNIIYEMTDEEKHKILNTEFILLWSDLWGSNIGIQYRGEERNAKEKFELLKNEVSNIHGKYNIQSLINETSTYTTWKEQEWGFPKGRHNYQEKDLICALREFEEETGYNRSSINVIQNLVPFEEIFTGSNYKSYKHKYFLAYINNDDNNNENIDDFNNYEVSKIEWKTYEDALLSIRHYNLEKIDILKRVHHLVTNYKIKKYIK